jgi:hypothetical protein
MHAPSGWLFHGYLSDDDDDDDDDDDEDRVYVMKANRRMEV